MVKVPNNAYMREFLQTNTSRKHSQNKSQDKIGYSKKEDNDFADEEEKIGFKDEKLVKQAIHENHLVVSSLLSFTNSLPNFLKLTVWTHSEK